MLFFAKLTLYALIGATIIFLYWFLPKYSLVQKNPGYCAPLTDHLYYCGTEADLGSMFSK
jgi:hypothetical protein